MSTPNFESDPLLAALTLRLASAAAPPPSAEALPCGPAIGLFEGTIDIGDAQPGSTLLKPHTGTYYVSGGGTEPGATGADAFHFAWRRFFGNGSITADIQFQSGPRAAREKAILLFRQSFEPGSPCAALTMHANGRIALEYRQSQGAVTFRIAACRNRATTLSLERFGGLFSASASAPGGVVSPVARVVLPLHDPLYAGLAVCSNDPERLATVVFSRVRLG